MSYHRLYGFKLYNTPFYNPAYQNEISSTWWQYFWGHSPFCSWKSHHCFSQVWWLLACVGFCQISLIFKANNLKLFHASSLCETCSFCISRNLIFQFVSRTLVIILLDHLTRDNSVFRPLTNSYLWILFFLMMISVSLRE